MKNSKLTCASIIAVIFSLILVSCSGTVSVTDKKAVLMKQEAIANEIVSNYRTACNATWQLNDTNVVNNTTEIKCLTERLITMSKELDATGPFPPDLRDATLKKLAAFEKTFHPKKSPQLRNAKNADIMAPALEKYLSEWVSLMEKAGLIGQ